MFVTRVGVLLQLSKVRWCVVDCDAVFVVFCTMISWCTVYSSIPGYLIV